MIACASPWGALLAPNNTASASGQGLINYRLGKGGRQQDPISSQLARVLTQGSRQALARLAQLEKDWDGNGSEKPRPLAIANAAARLPELYRLSCEGGLWREPHISASEDGEITFEWWSTSRKLTMYFGDGDAFEILRVWGTNIDNEMDLQSDATLEGFASAWSWLYGN